MRLRIQESQWIREFFSFETLLHSATNARQIVAPSSTDSKSLMAVEPEFPPPSRPITRWNNSKAEEFNLPRVHFELGGPAIDHQPTNHRTDRAILSPADARYWRFWPAAWNRPGISAPSTGSLTNSPPTDPAASRFGTGPPTCRFDAPTPPTSRRGARSHWPPKGSCMEYDARQFSRFLVPSPPTSTGNDGSD